MRASARERAGHERLRMSAWMGHEWRVAGLAVAAGLPSLAIALYVLWRAELSPILFWTLAVALVLTLFGGATALYQQVVRPLQISANLLAALREGDFSFRARGARPDDPLGLLLLEINMLATTLREERLSAVEATALLGKVMAEIDVAVFAFDGAAELRLVNRAGERLLARPAEELLGRSADALGIGEWLESETPRLLDQAFGAAGRWELRRSTFRQEGLPHHLVVLTDLSRALREEEREAWKRLIRVLSHEINNSLAPIKSLAASLNQTLARDDRSLETEQDLRDGLKVIAGRADALARFMGSYARLARLPAPRRGPVRVEDWVRRVVALETRMTVAVEPGPDMVLGADGDQLDQMLINLVTNAVDAAAETGGGVRVRWTEEPGTVLLMVEDDGPGLPPSANLFVPFFTTKPSGSGIGLVLSRQIAEAHGGSLELEDREEGSGCVARVRLPLVAVGAEGPIR